MCLFLCKYDAILIAIILQCSLKSSTDSGFVLFALDCLGYLGNCEQNHIFVVPNEI
jgi:hypothetical protein